MKPYSQIPIADCGEPLIAIPQKLFSRVAPHPYEALGAPYGSRSPYFLRQGALSALTQAQAELQQRRSGWRIQIFDAYRPVAVQQFMVEHSLNTLLASRGLRKNQLTPERLSALMDEVYQFWAAPSLDPASPPPHSTGAAVDITLVNDRGNAVAMGSPIDELSLRSVPGYFAQFLDELSQHFHQNRQLLYQVMTAAGFERHPQEWWHFSLGDQLWTWLKQQQGEQISSARYGGVSSPALQSQTGFLGADS